VSAFTGITVDRPATVLSLIAKGVAS